MVKSASLVHGQNDQYGDGTLKLIEFEEWIDWIFVCWYRFTKTKSWSKNVWVGIIKNGCGQSSYGTLKLTVSQK